MARVGLQWSVRDLAAKTGISATTISAIENGLSGGRGESLRRIEEAFVAEGYGFPTPVQISMPKDLD